jgi:hypothetical protein
MTDLLIFSNLAVNITLLFVVWRLVDRATPEPPGPEPPEPEPEPAEPAPVRSAPGPGPAPFIKRSKRR